MSGGLSLSLSIQYATHSDSPNRSQVRRWVRAALEEANVQRPVACVVRFCDRREARSLNRQFRGRDYATNVLTFPDGKSPPGGGDILICVPVLEKEAREQKKTIKSHVAHLVIHGTLHALGYDHVVPRQAQQMEAMESRILKRFSIADPYWSNS